MKYSKIFFALTILIMFISCGLVKKKWPEDSLGQMKAAEGIQLEMKFIDQVSNRNPEDYVRDLLAEFKSVYPDYRDFERAVEKKDEKIIEIRKKVTKKYVANSKLSSVFIIMANNSPAVYQLRNNPETSHLYNELQKEVERQLRQEFHDMNGFVDYLFSDPKVDILQKIGNEAGRKIEQMRLEEIRKEQERLNRIQAQEEYLRKIQSLIPVDRFPSIEIGYGSNKGYVNIINGTNTSVFFHLAYYHYGSQWEGWVCEGFALMPGERHSVKMRLNTSGYLNKYLYYYAESQDGRYVWSDDENHCFITLSSDCIPYRLPQAGQNEMLKNCSELDYVQSTCGFRERIADKERSYTTVP